MPALGGREAEAGIAALGVGPHQELGADRQQVVLVVADARMGVGVARFVRPHDTHHFEDGTDRVRTHRQAFPDGVARHQALGPIPGEFNVVPGDRQTQGGHRTGGGHDGHRRGGPPGGILGGDGLNADLARGGDLWRGVGAIGGDGADRRVAA